VKDATVLLVVLASLFPILVSCAPSGGSSTGGPSPEPTSPPPSASQNIPPEAEDQVALAVEDLARRLDIPREQIRVLKVERVEWGDTSLGCPQPGKMYAQVVTPGYRVSLEAKGKTYEYHTDLDRHVVLCEKGSQNTGPSTTR